MGIDALDIVFRLEKAFGLRIPRGECFPDVKGQPPREPTAGDLHEYVLRRYIERYGNLSADRTCDLDRPCPKCGYNLRGLHFGAFCPECGEPGLDRGMIWRGVRRVLRQALGVSRDAVRPESRIFSDLGAG